MYYNTSFLTDNEFYVLCRCVEVRIEKIKNDIDNLRVKYGSSLFETTNICKQLKLEYLHLLNLKSYLKDFVFEKSTIDCSIKAQERYTDSCNNYLNKLRCK